MPHRDSEKIEYPCPEIVRNDLNVVNRGPLLLLNQDVFYFPSFCLLFRTGSIVATVADVLPTTLHFYGLSSRRLRTFLVSQSIRPISELYTTTILVAISRWDYNTPRWHCCTSLIWLDTFSQIQKDAFLP
jgi:hypothetical protein